MATLDIIGLQVDYGDTTVVHDVDIQVPDGTLHTLLGPSGSGKTTILRAIAGFVEPTAGHINLDGRDLVGVSSARRDIGIVFQSYALFPHLNVFDNVAFGMQVRRTPRSQQRERVHELLALVRMPDHEDRRIDQLSGGQQQRVALARALALQPSLLLLDEPMSALDRKIRGQVQDEVREVQERTGVTTVLVTHDQDEAMALSDGLTVLDGGRVCQSGSPADVYHRPMTSFVADFLGSANVIEATVVEGHVSALGVRVGVPERSDGALVALAIRSEHLRIRPVSGDDPVSRRAEVRRVTATGPVLDVTLDHHAGPTDSDHETRLHATVLAHEFEGISVGDNVALEVIEGRVHVLPGDPSERTESERLAG